MYTVLPKENLGYAGCLLMGAEQLVFCTFTYFVKNIIY